MYQFLEKRYDLNIHKLTSHSPSQNSPQVDSGDDDMLSDPENNGKLVTLILQRPSFSSWTIGSF